MAAAKGHNTKLRYSREVLLGLRELPYCQRKPKNLDPRVDIHAPKQPQAQSQERRWTDRGRNVKATTDKDRRGADRDRFSRGNDRDWRRADSKGLRDRDRHDRHDRNGRRGSSGGGHFSKDRSSRRSRYQRDDDDDATPEWFTEDAGGGGDFDLGGALLERDKERQKEQKNKAFFESFLTAGAEPPEDAGKPTRPVQDNADGDDAADVDNLFQSGAFADEVFAGDLREVLPGADTAAPTPSQDDRAGKMSRFGFALEDESPAKATPAPAKPSPASSQQQQRRPPQPVPSQPPGIPGPVKPSANAADFLASLRASSGTAAMPAMPHISPTAANAKDVRSLERAMAGTGPSTPTRQSHRPPQTNNSASNQGTTQGTSRGSAPIRPEEMFDMFRSVKDLPALPQRGGQRQQNRAPHAPQRTNAGQGGQPNGQGHPLLTHPPQQRHQGGPLPTPARTPSTAHMNPSVAALFAMNANANAPPLPTQAMQNAFHPGPPQRGRVSVPDHAHVQAQLQRRQQELYAQQQRLLQQHRSQQQQQQHQHQQQQLTLQQHQQQLLRLQKQQQQQQQRHGQHAHAMGIKQQLQQQQQQQQQRQHNQQQAQQQPQHQKQQQPQSHPQQQFFTRPQQQQQQSVPSRGFMPMPASGMPPMARMAMRPPLLHGPYGRLPPNPPMRMQAGRGGQVPVMRGQPMPPQNAHLHRAMMAHPLYTESSVNVYAKQNTSAMDRLFGADFARLQQQQQQQQKQ